MANPAPITGIAAVANMIADNTKQYARDGLVYCIRDNTLLRRPWKYTPTSYVGAWVATNLNAQLLLREEWIECKEQ